MRGDSRVFQGDETMRVMKAEGAVFVCYLIGHHEDVMALSTGLSEHIVLYGLR